MSAAQKGFSWHALVFAAGTACSRVLGLVRDIVTFTLIPEASLAAFLVAFRLPNMFRDLVGEGAANAAFIPVFSEVQEKQGEAEFRKVVALAWSRLIIILGVLTVLGVVFVEIPLAATEKLQVITGGAPLDQSNIALMISAARWTFPYLFLIGMAVFAMGPLFAVRHYSTPSWTPALLNVALIVCCVPFVRGWFSDPVYALVLGVWIGGLTHVAVSWWAMGKYTGVWRPALRGKHPSVGKIYWLMVPVLIGQAANEVNKLVDLTFAAAIGKHAVNALALGNHLTQLPLSMFGFAVSAAILPGLSRAGARLDYDEMRYTLKKALRFSCFLILPSMLGLMVLSKPILRLLFEWHQRGPQQTLDAMTALACYASGLLAFAWVKVTVGGFYALQDTKTPVKIASLSMLLNVVFCVLLVRPLGFGGLAIATTLSFTVNFALLYLVLARRVGPLWDTEFIWGLARMGIAGGMMAAIAYAAYVNIHGALGQEGADTAFAARFTLRFVDVVVPVVVAGLAYLGFCRALRLPELAELEQVLRRKLGRGSATPA